MNLLYDHLLSVIIAGIIFMVMVQLRWTGQQAQVETTRYYAGRTQMIAFIETLQRDFQNVGAGVNPTSPMITAYTWNGTEKSIEFLATVDTTAGAPVELIKYHLIAVTGQSICGQVQCYELQRYVHTGSTYQPNGKSMSTLTEFEIQLYEGDGSPVGANLNDAREIQVRVAALSPMGEEGIIKRSRWQTRFQPVNLTLKDL